MLHIVICGLSGIYWIFPHRLMNGTIFENKVLKKNVYFDFLYNFCLNFFSFWEEFSEIGQKSILVFM